MTKAVLVGISKLSVFIPKSSYNIKNIDDKGNKSEVGHFPEITMLRIWTEK